VEISHKAKKIILFGPAKFSPFLKFIICTKICRKDTFASQNDSQVEKRGSVYWQVFYVPDTTKIIIYCFNYKIPSLILTVTHLFTMHVLSQFYLGNNWF